MAVNIFQAVKETCATCGHPLRPDANAGTIYDQLVNMNYVLTLDHVGRLCATKNDAPVTLSDAIAVLSRRLELANLFEPSLDRVVKYEELGTMTRKSQYIAKFGLDAYEQLLAQSSQAAKRASKF